MCDTGKYDALSRAFTGDAELRDGKGRRRGFSSIWAAGWRLLRRHNLSGILRAGMAGRASGGRLNDPVFTGFVV